MDRYQRDNRPKVKPVRKINISEQNIPLKALLVFVFLGIGVFFLSRGVHSLISTEEGVTQIEANVASDANNTEEFTFLYDLGSGTKSATALRKALISLYTDCLTDGYMDYNSDESFDGVENLYTINHNVGEVITVSGQLYDAFTQLSEADNRLMYLGPIYDNYENIFYSHDDSEITSFDPYEDKNLAKEYKTLCQYINDPKQIDLKLLGNNQVCLNISKEYQDYAKKMGYEKYIDFFWMRNAFIVDDIADALESAGYTHGSISSYDGYTRNLDDSKENVSSLHLYDRNLSDDKNGVVYDAATMSWNGVRNIVNYRAFPMQTLDKQHYYEKGDGTIRSAYIDPNDGFCKTATSNLILSSSNLGCVDMILSSWDVYIAENINTEKLNTMSKKGIYSLYCEDHKIISDDSSVTLDDFYEDDSVKYELK